MKIKQLFFTVSLLFASCTPLGAMEGSVNQALSGVDESPGGLDGSVVVASMPYQDGLSILAVGTNKGLVHLYFWDGKTQVEAIRFGGKDLVIDVRQGKDFEIARLEFDQEQKTIRVFATTGEQHDLTLSMIHFIANLRDYIEFDGPIIPSEQKIVKGDGGQGFCVEVNQCRTVASMGMLQEGVLQEGVLLGAQEFPKDVITAIDAVAYRDGKYLIALAYTPLMNVEFFTFDPRTREVCGLGHLEFNRLVPRIDRLDFNIEKCAIRIMFSDGQWREESLDFILSKDQDEAIEALSGELADLKTDDADSGESAKPE